MSSNSGMAGGVDSVADLYSLQLCVSILIDSVHRACNIANTLSQDCHLIGPSRDHADKLARRTNTTSKIANVMLYATMVRLQLIRSHCFSPLPPLRTRAGAANATRHPTP